MSVQLRIRSAVSARQDQMLRLAALCLLAALAQGCSAIAASPYRGPEPSDPTVRVAPPGYRSTTAFYRSQRPIDPRGWREQNERVTPTPKR